MSDQERCPRCGSEERHVRLVSVLANEECEHKWHKGHDSAPSSVAEQPQLEPFSVRYAKGEVKTVRHSREQAVEGLIEQCADEIVQTLLPSMDADMFVRHTKKVAEIIRQYEASRGGKQ